MWSPEIRVTSGAGPDLNPVAATDSNGRVWIAWQGFRNNNLEVLAAVQNGDGFHPKTVGLLFTGERLGSRRSPPRPTATSPLPGIPMTKAITTSISAACATPAPNRDRHGSSGRRSPPRRISRPAPASPTTSAIAFGSPMKYRVRAGVRTSALTTPPARRSMRTAISASNASTAMPSSPLRAT